jgi:hypothetical protein
VYIQQLREAVLPPVQNIVIIFKQITILILHSFTCRLVTPLKSIYSSMHVSNILVLTVRCTVLSFVFQIFPLFIPSMSLIFLFLLFVARFSVLSFRYSLFLFLNCLRVSRLLLFRLSQFLSLGSCNYAVWLVSFGLNILSIAHRTVAYASSIHYNLDYLSISKAVLISTSVSMFSKTAKPFEM